MESPGKWDTMPKGVACHIVALDPKSTEYSEVKSKFETSMGPLKMQQNPPSSRGMAANIAMAQYMYAGQQWSQIIKIERIQNPFLHAQYVAKKKTMDQHNPSNIVNERELFHGCPGDVAEKISHHGFNRSFAGKNGTYVAMLLVISYTERITFLKLTYIIGYFVFHYIHAYIRLTYVHDTCMHILTYIRSYTYIHTYTIYSYI